MQTYNIFQNTSLLFLRVVTASLFYVAAYYKFPFWSGAPQGISAFLLFTTRVLSIAEPLGATALLLGFLTRWASAGLVIIMLGAIYVTKFTFGMGFVSTSGPGWNFPLAVFAGCLILLAFGAGRWSVDGRKSR